MSKATNATLKNALRGSIDRLRQDAMAGDIERVKSGLYLIRDGVALLPRTDREAMTAQLRSLMRELDASAPATIRATTQSAICW